MNRKQAFFITLVMLFACLMQTATAAQPQFAAVKPGTTLVFPRDHGAHPEFRTEWWYATGWLQTPDKRSIGFQVTFFRSATEHDRANPSRFAPTQLIVAHAALSDPADGKLLHDQKIARAGFGLAQAASDDTNVQLQHWHMRRQANGRYEITLPARDFALTLTLTPSQPLLLQGERGFSRKGPRLEQASYYYSQPNLQVSGELQRGGKKVPVTGSAWLDHEWSSTVLDPRAVGWDWVGMNLDDGGALMAFQIRDKDGRALWGHAMMRDASGKTTQFAPGSVRFIAQKRWKSPRTGATYPVATLIETGTLRWLVTPLQDDQELDSRQSTGAVYWEGAARITRNGQPAGRGYLEMTGYFTPLKL